ncbi:MAG: hypothetical protein IM621_04105, partial [Phenylobacterium sp.]|uniref:hypothetical protein n=1 Tax=Phenylobacterium sp. TaxID=1871053 RepID=UPI0025D9BEF0
MPDNFSITGGKVTTREVTYSGETAALQTVSLATVSGIDDGKVATDLSFDNPLPVADYRTRDTLLGVLSLLQSPMGFDRNQGRGRVTALLESGTLTTVQTVNTVTTVSTVTTVNALTALANITGLIGNYQANQLTWGQNQA